ncbi:MAG: hypothetical protein AAGA58_08885 [Verrucomicrobiota bacterium]
MIFSIAFDLTATGQEIIAYPSDLLYREGKLNLADFHRIGIITFISDNGLPLEEEFTFSFDPKAKMRRGYGALMTHYATKSVLIPFDETEFRFSKLEPIYSPHSLPVWWHAPFWTDSVPMINFFSN